MKYAVEAIGTLFLVFTIGTAVRSGNPLAPLAIGAALMAMVYAVGTSGGAFNPAVAIGGVAMGMFSGSMIWMFVVAEAVAAVAAGLAFRALNPADK